MDTAPTRLRPRTDADLAKVRAALAEAGHRPDFAWLDPSGAIATDPTGIPQYAAWKACAVADVAWACWPCTRRWQRLGRQPVLCDHPIDPFCPETTTEETT